MKRIAACFFFYLLLCCAGSVSAQPESFASPERPFIFDVVAFHPDSSQTDSDRVDIYVAVPYRTISFVNVGDRYVADYGLIVQITDGETHKLLIDKYQARNVTQSTGDRERVPLDLNRADASQYSFALRQDHPYEIRISVQDLSTHHGSDTLFVFTPRVIPKDQFGSSDIMLYRFKRGIQVVPLIGTDLSRMSPEESGIFVETYNTKPSTPYGVVIRVLSEDESEAQRINTTIVSTGKEREPVLLPFAPNDLWPASYYLQVFFFADVQDTSLQTQHQLKTKALAWAEKKVEVSAQHGIPIAPKDIDEAIDQLSYIATPGEWDSLRSASTVREKRNAIGEFWQKRNPDYGSRSNRPMEVFYRRVQYANDNFRGTSRGWKTDRGRVYIQLGAPSYVDHHPYGVDQKPYETWEYYDLRTRYYFVDQYLFGDYRLASPPPPTGVFLWDRESY